MKLFKKLFGSLLIVGCLLLPFQPTVVHDGYFHNTTITIQSVVHAAGLTPNLLNEDFIDITSWTDADTDTAVSEIDPAGQLRLDTNAGAAGNALAQRYKDITSPPDKFTIEVLTYFDLIGTRANNDYVLLYYATATWALAARFCSDGLYITKTGAANGEVGADIVLCNAGAADQLWRFQVDKTGGEAAATVEVFLNNVSQGTFDCDYEAAQTNGRASLSVRGYTTDNMVAHIKHIRIATGLGAINDTSNPIVNIF